MVELNGMDGMIDTYQMRKHPFL